MIVLFVNASVPASVAKVPDVGKIRLVVLVVLKVISAPDPVTPVVVKFLPVLISPPSVIVFPVLLTPVPPFAPKAMPRFLLSVPQAEGNAQPSHRRRRRNARVVIGCKLSERSKQSSLLFRFNYPSFCV